MAYGITIFGADGRINLDAESITYAFVDEIEVNYGESGTKTYPDLEGYQIEVSQVQDSDFPNDVGDLVNWTGVDVSISYSSNVPQIDYNANQIVGDGGVVKLLVFAN